MTSSRRPNFLIMVADDLGFSDTSPYGSEISTPNLSRMAKDGLRMTDFYTAAACSPTRSMLLSGTDNHIAGLGQMAEFMMNAKVNCKGKPSYEGYRNFRVAALPEILQDAGYFRILREMALGMTAETSPSQRGFDKSLAYLPGTGIFGALTFALLVDHVGRRFFYHTLAPMAAVCMIGMGSIGAMHNPSKQAKLVIASMFPCYGFFLLGSFAPLGILIPAETPSPRLRDKTAMAAFTVQNQTNFVTTFIVPYLVDAGYANLRAKVGFLNGLLGLAGCVWAFFYYPELKGCLLKEINFIFIENIPARHTQ
ncbi:arylsulfatase, partial [Fusarium agapanthi]